MAIIPPINPAESELRFLEYRLEVVQGWPPSARKLATAQAIARRVTSIGRSALARPEVDHLLASSCRMLEILFSAEAAHPRHAVRLSE